MIFSNYKKTLVLLNTVLVLASCGKKNDHLVDVTNSATFYVDKGVALTGKTTLERDSQQKPNKKNFNIQACIKDNALLQAVQYLDFAVEVQEGVSITRRTDQFGCIIWNEQISYDALSNEAELLVERKITALNGHSGSVVLELSMNPWASEDGLTLTDLRYDSALRSKVTKGAVNYSMVQVQSDSGDKIDSIQMIVDKKKVADSVSLKNKSGDDNNVRMRLDAIQIQFLGHDYSAYEMTSTLNLKIAHKYRIRISPQFIRENFNGKQIFETIVSGNIKFNLAILRDTINFKNTTNYNPSDVLTTAQFVGEMIDGVMVADVTLKFQDLAPLTGRTYLLLSSAPEPGYIQFKDGNYISPLGALPAASQAAFVPTNWSAEKIYKNQTEVAIKQKQNELAKTNFDYFKEKSKFIEIPANQATASGQNYASRIKATLLSNLQSGKKEVSVSEKSALCSLLVGSKVMNLNACYADPENFVNIRKREIVESVSSVAPERVGMTYNEDLNINMNFSSSNDQSTGDSTSKKYGYSANAGLSAGLDIDLLSLVSNVVPVVGTITKTIVEKLLEWVLGVKLNLPKLSASVSGSASYSRDLYTWSLANSKKESGSISTTLKFAANAEMKMFSFQGTFRPCYLVSLTSAAKAKLEQINRASFEKMGLPEGAYVCSDKTLSGTRKEMYVLVNSSTGIAGSPLTDSSDSSEAPLRMFFRGPTTYSIFKNLVQKENFEMQFNKFPAEQVIQSIKDMKMPGDIHLNQEFPGLLNPVIE